jgi:hypothetical protein
MPLDNNPGAGTDMNSGMTSDVNSEIAALKNQVFSLLVALVVVTGSLTVYLYRQDSMLGKQCNQFNSALAVMNQARPSINNFVYSLMVYGQKHPEFLPLLKKYGIAPPPPGTSLPSPNAPAK